MIIEEKDFKLESGSTLDRYDLYLKKIVNKGKKGDESGKGGEREDWVIEGYDMTLYSVLTKLIHYRINQSSDTYTLKEYFKAYLKFRKELIELIRNDN